MKNKDLSKVRLDIIGLFLAGLFNTFFALGIALLVHGPGSAFSQPDMFLRAEWIAENSGIWKAGWFFWFAPTLTFSWSYFAIGRHLDAKYQWRNLAIGLALIAAAVDIVGVLINLTVLPELAAASINMPETALNIIFLSMEKLANALTNIGGYGLYSLAGMILLPAVFATRRFPSWLKWLGVVEWSISLLATLLLILAPALSAGPFVISFFLFAPWVWGSALWIIRDRAEK